MDELALGAGFAGPSGEKFARRPVRSLVFADFFGELVPASVPVSVSVITSVYVSVPVSVPFLVPASTPVSVPVPVRKICMIHTYILHIHTYGVA